MFGWAPCDFLKYILWPNMIGSGWLYIIIFAICNNLLFNKDVYRYGVDLMLMPCCRRYEVNTMFLLRQSRYDVNTMYV